MSTSLSLPKNVRPTPVTISLGPGRSFELASNAVLEAFFATVSYRLEPDGWATRFPLTLDYLRAGRLGPAEAAGVLAELETIGRELRALPARKAVWDYQDTRPRLDAGGEIVNPAAENLHDYFVTADGRTPLVQRWRELAEASRDVRQTVRIATTFQRKQLKNALALFLFGSVLGTAALIWFPNYFLTGHGSKNGPLIWAVGYLMAGFGAWMLLESRSPALADRRRRHAWLSALIGGGITLAVLIASWQDEHATDGLPRISPRAAPTPADVKEE